MTNHSVATSTCSLRNLNGLRFALFRYAHNNFDRVSTEIQVDLFERNEINGCLWFSLWYRKIYILNRLSTWSKSRHAEINLFFDFWNQTYKFQQIYHDLLRKMILIKSPLIWKVSRKFCVISRKFLVYSRYFVKVFTLIRGRYPFIRKSYAVIRKRFP